MTRWRIVNNWGEEPDMFEDCTWPTEQLAQEECDWLHEHEGIDTDDGFGVDLSYYHPVRVGEQLKFDQYGLLIR